MGATLEPACCKSTALSEEGQPFVDANDFVQLGEQKLSFKDLANRSATFLEKEFEGSRGWTFSQRVHSFLQTLLPKRRISADDPYTPTIPNPTSPQPSKPNTAASETKKKQGADGSLSTKRVKDRHCRQTSRSLHPTPEAPQLPGLSAEGRASDECSVFFAGLGGSAKSTPRVRTLTLIASRHASLG